MAATIDHHEARQRLRKRKEAEGGHEHPVNVAHHDEATFGERLADRVAGALGSWTFLIIQTCAMAVWIAVNIFGLFIAHWDPYPFILLNLMLSLQATYAGPIVLLAGNRQSQRDRLTLEHAAMEAEKGADQVNRILVEIRSNTKLTLDILKDLEARV
jgi:uncharacterized membrane protein